MIPDPRARPAVDETAWATTTDRDGYEVLLAILFAPPAQESDTKGPARG